MRSEERSAISVVFVLLIAATMTAVAVAPDPGTGSANATAGLAENATVSQAQNVTVDQAQNVTVDQEANATSATTVSVGATGEVQGQPDVAVVDLESSATASDPGTAADRLARNASQLREALTAANVSAEQIRTTYYDVSRERPDPDRAGDGNETVYRARQGFAVTVENTSRVGDVVDVAVDSGATAVRNVEFRLSEANRSALRERALTNAMDRARSDAAVLAEAEGLTVTEVRSITTVDEGVQPFVAEQAALEADAAATEIESGPVTVRATVQVTYEATEE